MEMGSGMTGFPIQGNPEYQADPRINVGYRNIYGTRLGVNVSPVSKQASLDAQFPIGDHQRQLFLQGGAYVKPGFESGAPADYGFRLGFSKKIQPTGVGLGGAIDRAFQRNIGTPSDTINASTRSEFFNTLTPEQLKILGQDARKIQRESVDEELGIRPGQEKYGFGVDVSVPSKRKESSPVPLDFAREYASQLQDSDSSFADPNRDKGSQVIDEIPRVYNPATHTWERTPQPRPLY
jgi:hypothetical protein